MTSFGIAIQTEGEANENEALQCVALLCAGLLRRGIVCEVELMLRCVMALSAACQRYMMVQYCCGSGSTDELFCRCFFTLTGSQLSDLKCMVILDDFGRRKITRAA